ncbi:MAG: 2-oxoacid:acceptor oxidoreductase subunit alpha [Porticoccaceae bacterium]|nr:2-oxoacid:acceptor oxidoreductase subunit alpha [Porticoccaceae bacterium]
MTSLTIAMVGSGGAGVVASGEMLLRAAAGMGLYGILRKTFGPQIRGGESAAIVRLGTEVVANLGSELEVLLVLDWNNFQRFADEIPISEATVLIQDLQAGEHPQNLPEPRQTLTLDFLGLAKSLGSSHSNLALLGYVADWLGCPSDIIDSAIRHRLREHSQETIELAITVALGGAQLQQDKPIPLQPILSAPEKTNSIGKRWIANGNQLIGLGALEAGIRFVAAYPITPASDVLEWMAGEIESVGGHLVQAEDELAAVNMTIGAGFGGIPAMTATSGPGMALMSEAMGLAVASETPLVVVDVMRGGPSTGIPTKSEQSDFNLAVYGLHGDAPHVVLSALSVADCHFTAGWATGIATERQTLVVVLSDQFLGQSSQIMPPLANTNFSASAAQQLEGDTEVDGTQRYFRYLDTDSGISPLALPGQPGGMFTADGLEHNAAAVPSPKAADHEQQLAKRLRKLDSLVESEHWAEHSSEQRGQGSMLLICWGSLYQVALEAQDKLREKGIDIVVMGIRLLSPLPLEEIKQAMQQATQTLVIEQNQLGQFAHYLRSFDRQGQDAALPPFHQYCRPGPTLFTPAEIVTQIQALIPDQTATEGSARQ